MIDKFFDGTHHSERFMTLCGFAGIGKSALAKHTCSYVKERNLISGGIVYINGRTIKDFDQLLSKIIYEMQNHPSRVFDQGRNNKKSIQKSFDTL